MFPTIILVKMLLKASIMKEDGLHVVTSVCLSSPFPLLVATQPTLTAPGVLKLNARIAIGGRDDLNGKGLWHMAPKT